MTSARAIFLSLALLPIQLAAVASAADDIIHDGSGITLGRNWYLHETSGGDGFRWVDNNAEIVVHRPSGNVKKVSLTLEAGPGLGVVKFPLTVLDQDNHTVATVTVVGKQAVRLDLPVQNGRDETFKLHVANGGKRVPKDPRILDFRVFDVADASNDTAMAPGHPDILSGSDAHLGANWYPLEQFKGQTFRWIDNNAEIVVHSGGDAQRRLRIDAQAGPSIKSPGNFMIALQDSSGKTIQTAPIKGTGFAYLNLPLHSGDNTFKLHVDSTGKKAPNDPRVLDFRVFNLAVM
jgi:hypothetical protein